MKPERCLVKSGWDWLIFVSTETVHFRPCRLHCTGLVTLTCSARFSLQGKGRGSVSEGQAVLSGQGTSCGKQGRKHKTKEAPGLWASAETLPAPRQRVSHEGLPAAGPAPPGGILLRGRSKGCRRPGVCCQLCHPLAERPCEKSLPSLKLEKQQGHPSFQACRLQIQLNVAQRSTGCYCFSCRTEGIPRQTGRQTDRQLPGSERPAQRQGQDCVTANHSQFV